MEKLCEYVCIMATESMKIFYNYFHIFICYIYKHFFHSMFVLPINRHANKSLVSVTAFFF